MVKRHFGEILSMAEVAIYSFKKKLFFLLMNNI
jgi:hypothetical protein